MNKLEFGEKIVARAHQLGADEAEVYVSESSSVGIEVVNKQPHTVNYQDRAGYGLRLLKDGRMGFASSNNFDISAVDDIIRRLIGNTGNHSPDEHNTLPESLPSPPSDDLVSFDETVKYLPIEEKIKKAVAIETAALETDHRITQAAWLQYADETTEYAIISSRGIKNQVRCSEVSAFLLAVAAELNHSGQPDPETAQTGIAMDTKARFDELIPQAVGQKAARYALRMLGAQGGHTGEMEAVFPPETSGSFIDLVSRMVNADLVQKKKSIYTNKLGEMVASDIVTIIDDGRLKGGLASAEVDAEGVPTTTKEIVKNGRLTQLLYDSYTAHRDNTVSTGNADRNSYRSRPIIAPTNFYLQKGHISREKLIGDIDNGLYLTEVTGLHAAVDAVTGDFSIPCKGILIRHGELSIPVSNITISGNFFDFFKNIVEIADDLTWEVQENVIGTPTFKVKNIKVSGK